MSNQGVAWDEELAIKPYAFLKAALTAVEYSESYRHSGLYETNMDVFSICRDPRFLTDSPDHATVERLRRENVLPQ